MLFLTLIKSGCSIVIVLFIHVAMGGEGTSTGDNDIHTMVEKTAIDALHLTKSTTELMVLKVQEQKRITEEKQKLDNMEKKRRQSVITMPFSAGGTHLFTPPVELDENKVNNNQQAEKSLNPKASRRKSVAEGIYDQMTPLSDVHMQMDYFGIINKETQETSVLPEHSVAAESVYGVSKYQVTRCIIECRQSLYLFSFCLHSRDAERALFNISLTIVQKLH